MKKIIILFFLTTFSLNSQILSEKDRAFKVNEILKYRLENLLPELMDKTGIDNVNIFFSGDNLFISTAREGYNPTVREFGNTSRNLYAPLSSFTLGARIKF